MAVLARPAQVGDVNHAVDAGLDLDERAEIGHAVARAAVTIVPGGYFRAANSHGFGFDLLDAQRDFLLLLVDVQHDDFDLVAEIDHLARVRQPPGPAHLADVDETFDPVFQPDEHAVVHHVDDACP